MRNIIKCEAPEYWSRILKKNPYIQYKDLEPKYQQEKSKLKIDMLKKEQYYLCCYCCKRVDESSSHIEHFRSRDSFPNLSMEYSNLLISCTGNTCGKKKDKYDFSPSVSYIDWESRFTYTVDGRIISKENDLDAGLAIELLNLNDQSLVKIRRELYDECVRYAKYMGKEYIKETYIDLNGEYLPRFAPMVEYFYNLGHFDADVVSLF